MADSTRRPVGGPDPSGSEDVLREFQMLREIVESIGYVFWLRDLTEERILYVSPAFEKIWGRSVQSLLGSPRVWMDSIHPDDREQVISAALGNARVAQDAKRYRILRPDGSVRRIEDRAYPVRNERGDVYRLAGVARDVTGALGEPPTDRSS
ncbi:MAG TPA: PAS domain-containing protein [Planctomycetota bacterium]|nr:PAS domain-containing protein [Planctomycetota bacterium]